MVNCSIRGCKNRSERKQEEITFHAFAMSAVGTEFVEYIARLERCGDRLPVDPQPLVPTQNGAPAALFEYNNCVCSVCNGYYGPSFGEPVCITCHAFLFPDFASYLPTSYFYCEKTDDGDSGNDEPSDLNYGSERRSNRCSLHSLPVLLFQEERRGNAQLPSTWSPGGQAQRQSRYVPPPRRHVARRRAVCRRGSRGRSLSLDDRRGETASNEIYDMLDYCGAGLRSIGPALANSVEKERSPDEEMEGEGPGTSGGGEEARRGLLAAAAAVGVGPPPPQPPSVQRSLYILSTPRPDDNIAPGLVEHLPPEVLLGIFGYLDDLSLCACMCVCTRWRGLLRAQHSLTRWSDFTRRRWPLFRPFFLNFDWYKTYQSLVESSFCRNCLVQMCVQSQPSGSENSWRRNRLRAELKIMRNDPSEGIAAQPLDVKSCHWQASITGPVGSPYEGGIFYLYIQVPYGYPMSPPVVRFLTKILHPNVSRHGDVGIDSVHHNWSLALTISKVLISIQSLLTDPYTAVCMEPQLGELYMRDRPSFEALARQWTWRYAMQDALPYNTLEYD